MRVQWKELTWDTTAMATEKLCVYVSDGSGNFKALPTSLLDRHVIGKKRVETLMIDIARQYLNGNGIYDSYVLDLVGLCHIHERQIDRERGIGTALMWIVSREVQGEGIRCFYQDFSEGSMVKRLRRI